MVDEGHYASNDINNKIEDLNDKWKLIKVGSQWRSGNGRDRASAVKKKLSGVVDRARKKF
jgi:chromosome condensin MukBEF MukE localization factor